MAIYIYTYIYIYIYIYIYKFIVEKSYLVAESRTMLVFCS